MTGEAERLGCVSIRLSAEWRIELDLQNVWFIRTLTIYDESVTVSQQRCSHRAYPCKSAEPPLKVTVRKKKQVDNSYSPAVALIAEDFRHLCNGPSPQA